MEYTQALLVQYRVPTPKIWMENIPEKPPWTQPTIKVCPFVENRKINQPETVIRAKFLAHCEKHTSQHVYTDGSKKDQHVGFAAVFQNETESGSLPGEASIFTAELYAIKMALDKILKTNLRDKNYTFFSDSQSALLALKSRITTTPIILDIKNMIEQARSRKLEVDFCWVPGHVNISGNEKADKAAKEAAANVNPLTFTRPVPHTDTKRTVKAAVKAKWQEHWLSPHQGEGKLREVKRDVGIWHSSYNKSRRIETALSRLRIGHTNITHAYLMERLANPPECESCRVPITVKHILVECRKFTTIRNKYYNNPTLADMLAESSNFCITKITKYLKETDLFSKI